MEHAYATSALGQFTARSLPHEDEVGGSLPAEFNAPGTLSFEAIAIGRKPGFGPCEGRPALVRPGHFHKDTTQRTGSQHHSSALKDLFFITVHVELEEVRWRQSVT